MKLIKPIFIFCILLCSTNNSYAEILSQDSPEVKQLIAMGYEISPAKKEDFWTIAKSSNSTLLLKRNDDTVLFARSFSRKKSSDSVEVKLMKVVNKMNVDTSYQVTITEDSLSFARYQTGPFNAKVFAQQVRLMEQIDFVIASYESDKIYELTNGK
jgi:S-adenosylmethionine:tRNA-ribosyltransferase-isomerase (queuine synthetase)